MNSISKYTQNPEPIKEKNDEVNYIKLRRFCMAKKKIFLKNSKKMTNIKKLKVKKKTNQKVRKIFQPTS